jgi:hypothetical protein
MRQQDVLSDEPGVRRSLDSVRMRFDEHLSAHVTQAKDQRFEPRTQAVHKQRCPSQRPPMPKMHHHEHDAEAATSALARPSLPFDFW